MLTFGVFLLVLYRAGWRPGDATGDGSGLHHAYLQATTMAWMGIVACQIGTAMAVRTERSSLRRIGPLSNPRLLAGLAVGVAVALLLVYLPPLRPVFGTAPPSAGQLAMLAPFPFIVGGADELRRALMRRRAGTR